MSLRLAKFAALLGTALGQMIKSTVGDGINVSIAIPDVEEGPFDVLVKVVAPAGTGWAAVAWGGHMQKNPLTVAWPNEGSVVGTARWATKYAAPQVYDDATITILKSSTSGSDGWTASFICSGCSEWDGGSLDPTGDNEFAWAFSKRGPTNPASAASTIPAHTDKDTFTVDLSKAKLSEEDWNLLIEELDDRTSKAKDKEEMDEDEAAVPDDGVEDIAIVDDADTEIKVEKPVVQTSVIMLNPPSATAVSDVDGADDADVDREGKIPRPTFAPIPVNAGEPAEAPSGVPDRISRPDIAPSVPDDEPATSPDKIPRPDIVPSVPDDEPATSPDKIPRPDIVPSVPDDEPATAPGMIPRPDIIPAMPESPDMVPRPDMIPTVPESTPVGSPDRIPRPDIVPDMPANEPVDTPDMIPRPDILPDVPASVDSPDTIPRPTGVPNVVPDAPLQEPWDDPDRIPAPMPRPIYDPNAPDEPLPTVVIPWDDGDDWNGDDEDWDQDWDDDIEWDDWDYNPPAAPTSVPWVPIVQPSWTPVAPVAPVVTADPGWGAGRGGGRGGGRGRGRGRGG